MPPMSERPKPNLIWSCLFQVWAGPAESMSVFRKPPSEDRLNRRCPDEMATTAETRSRQRKRTKSSALEKDEALLLPVTELLCRSRTRLKDDG